MKKTPSPPGSADPNPEKVEQNQGEPGRIESSSDWRRWFEEEEEEEDVTPHEGDHQLSPLEQPEMSVLNENVDMPNIKDLINREGPRRAPQQRKERRQDGSRILNKQALHKIEKFSPFLLQKNLETYDFSIIIDSRRRTNNKNFISRNKLLKHIV